ncbi:ATP-binding cassette domain-containing protein, partial [Candidatus Poribacteria bacterium]|nr:ATP-binding cassette domain-containing protein [Candidatus Poribacteria bacterium]
MAILELVNIKKIFGPKRVLDGISWQADEDEKVALVGLNGSGKSTLLKIIGGIIPTDSGTVRINPE